ncbi:MAG TPA: YbaB/EbfC family nucleoid-associated protein [Candidatus Pacearchaeota archaeon]|nr:YbaB/EbfC family nucleoid-associated protein [Candidatus Pacearchaeota archaeon]
MIKQLKQLKDLQDNIKKQKVEVEKNGVKIVLNGAFELEDIALNPMLDKNAQEKAIKECFRDAGHQIQAKVMENSTQIKNMLGM